jgi:hypothetical protein
MFFVHVIQPGSRDDELDPQGARGEGEFDGAADSDGHTDGDDGSSGSRTVHSSPGSAYDSASRAVRASPDDTRGAALVSAS